jgi:hypothetical protein
MTRGLFAVLAAAAGALAAGCNHTCSDLAQRYHDTEAKAKLCEPSQSDPCPFTLPTTVSVNGGSPEVSDCMGAFNAGAGAQLRVLYEEYQKDGCPVAGTTCGNWDGTGAVCRTDSSAAGYICTYPLP